MTQHAALSCEQAEKDADDKFVTEHGAYASPRPEEAADDETDINRSCPEPEFGAKIEW